MDDPWNMRSRNWNDEKTETLYVHTPALSRGCSAIGECVWTMAYMRLNVVCRTCGIVSTSLCYTHTMHALLAIPDGRMFCFHFGGRSHEIVHLLESELRAEF